MAFDIPNNDNISNSGNDDSKPTSGETSPDGRLSVSSVRPRSNTETTLVSTAPDDSRTVSTAMRPDVPANTPVARSVAEESIGIERVLKRVSTITVDENGMARQGGQDGKQDPEGVKESTMWGGEAEEMAALGLKRLVQLAKDEHDVDPSKSVGEYYSEHLDKVIREAEVEFKPFALK